MKFLSRLHVLTEIGSMIAQSVASVWSAQTLRAETSHADRIATLKAEIEAIKAAKGRGKK